MSSQIAFLPYNESWANYNGFREIQYNWAVKIPIYPKQPVIYPKW